jgi:large conductance mechanosensitive channel
MILQEFKNFISRGNVIDLAVGIIIGAAFTGIVNSLVNDILMPMIGMITGGIDFSNYFVSLKGGQYVTLKAAKEAGVPAVAYGLFINHVMNFLIVSFVIFMLVKQINRLKKHHEAQEAKTTPTQVELLTQIRDLLQKESK